MTQSFSESRVLCKWPLFALLCYSDNLPSNTVVSATLCQRSFTCAYQHISYDKWLLTASLLDRLTDAPNLRGQNMSGARCSFKQVCLGAC